MYVDITKKPRVTCVEWFHGYGGNALGLKRAIPGLRSIAVCERDAFVVANMVSKMEKGLLDAVPIWTDVTDFPTEPFDYQQLDLFAASYPCQPFSHAGKRGGANDSKGRHLWPYCRKFIGTVRPRYVWLENVEGHVSLGLSTVLADLEEDGYTAAWGIFSASEVGAPHQRKRVFILAYRNDGGFDGQSFCAEQPGGAEAIGTGERDNEDVAHFVNEGLQGLWGQCKLSESERQMQTSGMGGHGVWPSRPGAGQYGWEPPRVVDDAKRRALRDNHGANAGQVNIGEGADVARNETDGQTQPPMGRNADGPADGLDFPGCTGLSDTELAEIREWMVKGTNRTDELRMCGNGVVPQTAERAFHVLYAELTGPARPVDDVLKESI